MTLFWIDTIDLRYYRSRTTDTDRRYRPPDLIFHAISRSTPEKGVDRFFATDQESASRIAQTAASSRDDAPGSIAIRIAPQLTSRSVEIAREGIVTWQKLRCYNGIMQTHLRSLAHLTNDQLLEDIKTLAGREREATVQLIASLGELDARRLYLGEGFPSLFTYCTQLLHLSEHAAYRRMEAARIARRIPEILELLADGSLTLTTVGLLAPQLTPENQRELLQAARHKSKREVEKIVAALRPQPAVPSSVRKLPAPRDVRSAPAEVPVSSALGRDDLGGDPTTATAMVHMNPAAPLPRPAVVAPLAPERYKVQVTISRDAHDNLRRAQDLLRHVIPNGDPAAIFERALSLLVDDLERKKLAAAKHPRPATVPTPRSRHVPAAVRREVWARDEGRCAFVGAHGRCPERGFLEFHHLVPFVDGGATDTANLQLRCRAHNAFEADAWFGLVEMQNESDPSTRSGPSSKTNAG